MDARRDRSLLTPGDPENTLICIFVEKEFWQLFWPGEGPLAMHGILSVGGPAQCAFSLPLFITGILRGVAAMVLSGLIHGLELKLFSNSC